ncbi:hypothetical protein DFP74_0547 [Nocardiopsis sp. Huas11]|uniref:hypothetical protein n=1 Tax=Nocardiopsis sp. Huas11 TaxID=2183912 RepID=UPI000EAF8CFD|nr:hypothetical protein [Nocardiopsis sp. Huas11]RKS04967.1 hypothetical protein DFP74_0547 [Nocardiopsis sp. Huas11]
MRAIAVIAGRVFARPKPPTEAEIADRARARHAQELATAYEKAIAQELAARGRAVHLYRTEGESQASRRAVREHTSAERYREDMGTTLFQLRAHRTITIR